MQASQLDLASELLFKIQVVEGDWTSGRGVALLSFASYREAELWKDSVPEIKQPDWLDGVDLIIVPVNQMPSDKHHYVQLMEISFKDMSQFVTDYSTDATTYLSAAAGASAGVVSTSRMERIKGSWQPPYLIINFWEKPADFEQSYTSKVYQPLKEKRLLSATTTSIIFQLEPLHEKQ